MIDLREKDKAILMRLAQEIFSEGTEIWAYGSRIKGTNHDASDLDLVVRIDTVVNPISDDEHFEQLTNFKEALQESTIPIFVQTFSWAHIPETFKVNIQQQHQVLIKVE